MGDAPTGLDVITIGRSSIDLYGQQIGARLEDTITKTNLEAVDEILADVDGGALTASEAIERLHDRRIEEYLDRLAYHFSRAEAWPKAVHYGLRAAE